ncbi:hypothetical protein ACHAXA_007216 [Cyclostephanos tholiformis]|uniref:Uncharacterized protein n=1 Tax=Cyclostephanos tholiformis TaxID=382380 RepID=A0ABD3SGB8_9STRA
MKISHRPHRPLALFAYLLILPRTIVSESRYDNPIPDERYPLALSNLRTLFTKHPAESYADMTTADRGEEDDDVEPSFLDMTEVGDVGHGHENEVVDDTAEGMEIGDDLNGDIASEPDDTVDDEASTNDNKDALYSASYVRDRQGYGTQGNIKESTPMDYVCGGVILILVGFHAFNNGGRVGYRTLK